MPGWAAEMLVGTRSLTYLRVRLAGKACVIKSRATEEESSLTNKKNLQSNPIKFPPFW